MPRKKQPIEIGKRFGQLVVVKEVASEKTSRRKVLCRCDCGGERIERISRLISGETIKCTDKKAHPSKHAIIPDIGEKHGALTIVKYLGVIDGNGMVVCKCDCGTEITARYVNVRKGPTSNCGCINKSRSIPVIGEKHGMLTIERDLGAANGNTRVICKCDCGKEHELGHSTLVNGSTKSCGCYRPKIRKSRPKKPKKKPIIRVARVRKQGYSRTRLYRIYKGIKYRCNNENSKDYADYGGRGIKLCHEWEISYHDFKKWALANGYEPHLQIDRKDSNRGYSPQNCRFTTHQENMRNRRGCYKWHFNYQWHETAKEAAISCGLDTSTVQAHCAKNILHPKYGHCYREARY